MSSATPAARVVPGLALSLLVAVAAWVVAARVPFGSAPVLAIVVGLLVGALLGPRPVLRPGLGASSSTLLRGAVVVLGAQLPLTTVLAQGARSLPVIVVTLGGCLLVATVLGRRLGIVDPLRTLIGVGTGVCGASAIAAVTPVLDTEEVDVGYAVATIFLFNVLAVLLFPPLGHALGMSQHTFGVFAGTAVNDLSSVVAVGNVYGSVALSTGVVVKLTRTLMIVPITAILAERQEARRAEGVGTVTAVAGRAPDRHGGRNGSRVGRTFLRAVARTPRFLLGFLALAAVASTGLIPASLTPTIGELATAMITVALAAVGLSIDLAGLRRTGLRPVALGAALWVTVSALSLGVMALGLGL
jgi:uncharacterized integral membrane protein (TIGR00698 family)